MCLIFRENFDEVVEIRNTSPSEKLKQLAVAVTWLYNVDNVFSLWPRDTSDCRTSKLSDKCIVGVNAIQQLNTINIQLPHPSFIQRSNLTVLSSNICTLICIIINCFSFIVRQHTDTRY